MTGRALFVCIRQAVSITWVSICRHQRVPTEVEQGTVPEHRTHILPERIYDSVTEDKKLQAVQGYCY
jgi:hypothetical protein